MNHFKIIIEVTGGCVYNVYRIPWECDGWTVVDWDNIRAGDEVRGVPVAFDDLGQNPEMQQLLGLRTTTDTASVKVRVDS